MESAWSLASSSDKLYISDRKKRQVICTQLDGKFLWRNKLGRPFSKYKKALGVSDVKDCKSYTNHTPYQTIKVLFSPKSISLNAYFH